MSIAKRLIEEELNKKSQAEIDKDELDEINEIYLSKMRSRASDMSWQEACAQMDDLIKSSIRRDDFSSKERIELLAAWERIQRG